MNAHFVRGASVVAVITATALALTACGSSDQDASANQTITLAALAGPPSFDPAAIAPGPTYNFVAAAYETLVFPAADGSLQPGIATDWQYTSSTSLTMNLRDNVRFSDGTGLDAALVVANIDRYRTTAGPNQSRMNNISEVDAVDDDTVTITLSTPDPSLPQAFSVSPGMMVSQAALDNPSILADAPAGSGMWNLDTSSVVANSSYEYVPNEEYSGSMTRGFANIKFTVINDLTAQLNALLAGDVDVAVAQWTQRETAESQGMAGVGIAGNAGGIWLLDRDGTLAAPLKDLRVRQAMNYALDRPTIARALWGDYARPTDQVFGTATTGYDESLDNYYSYDPEKAKELLAEAGYPDGFTLQVVSQATFGDNGRLEAEMPYLQAVGINVELVDRTSDFTAAYTSGQYPAMQGQGSMVDSFVGANFFLSANSPINPFHTSDPELDALIADAAQQLDPDQAAAAWQKVSKWVVENAWFAPVAWYETHNIYNPKVVSGVVLTPGQPVSLPFSWQPAQG